MPGLEVILYHTYVELYRGASYTSCDPCFFFSATSVGGNGVKKFKCALSWDPVECLIAWDLYVGQSPNGQTPNGFDLVTMDQQPIKFLHFSRALREGCGQNHSSGWNEQRMRDFDWLDLEEGGSGAVTWAVLKVLSLVVRICGTVLNVVQRDLRRFTNITVRADRINELHTTSKKEGRFVQLSATTFIVRIQCRTVAYSYPRS